MNVLATKPPAAAQGLPETAMRFGLFGSAQARRGPSIDSAAGFHEFVDYTVESEALGYHSSFIVEHHFTGFGQVSASLNLLTWVAARTTTLRLGTAVLVLPWHNPVLLAEQAATIDLLSGGRLDFGVGRGYRHNEFAGFCIPMEEAEARYEEALDVITRAWTSEAPFSHRGRYWQFDNIVVEPPTAQKPHPPFWTGAGGRASIRRCVERGHSLLIDQFCSFEQVEERLGWYREALAEAGRPFDPMQVAIARAIHVTHDPADKQAALDRRLAGQARTHDLAQTPGGDNKASILSYDDTREANEAATLFGTPDEIAAKLERLRAMGVRYLLLNGGATTRDNIRRFAADVMPAFSN